MTDSAALQEAFARLEVFTAVQLAEHGKLTPEGVERLQEAVGIGAEERRVIRACIPAPAADHGGAVLMGVLVGLFAAQDSGRPLSS